MVSSALTAAAGAAAGAAVGAGAAVTACFEAWTTDWNERKANGKWKDAPGYGMAKTGFICLQDHGSEAWFKNIKIKKL